MALTMRLANEPNNLSGIFPFAASRSLPEERLELPTIRLQNESTANCAIQATFIL